MQVRCIDAAREAARLAARGDEHSALEAARAIAPGGAAVRLHREGDFVIATVTAASHLLPGLAIAGKAVSAAESFPARARAPRAAGRGFSSGWAHPLARANSRR